MANPSRLDEDGVRVTTTAIPSREPREPGTGRGERESSSRHHRSSTSSSHHHHRTISSTTLLLVLSLILAVLAVMLSLPAAAPPLAASPAAASASVLPEAGASGIWSYLTPRRSQAIVFRESAVAQREADVARREAELLLGSPGGVAIPPNPAGGAPPAAGTGATPPSPACPSMTVLTHTVTVAAPAATVFREVEQIEDASATANAGKAAWWDKADARFQELLEREHRVSDREKEVGMREETVGRRETDAGRRESWIMEQLISIGNEPQPTHEEEYVYEGTERPNGGSVPPPRRKAKPQPKQQPQQKKPKVHQQHQEADEKVVHITTKVETETETLTTTVPKPAGTRLAAFPAPAPTRHVHQRPLQGPNRGDQAAHHVEILHEEGDPLPPVPAEPEDEAGNGGAVAPERKTLNGVGKTTEVILEVQRTSVVPGPEQTRMPTTVVREERVLEQGPPPPAGKKVKKEALVQEEYDDGDDGDDDWEREEGTVGEDGVRTVTLRNRPTPVQQSKRRKPKKWIW